MIDVKQPLETPLKGEKQRKYTRVDDLLRVDYRKVSQQVYQKYEGNCEGICQRIFGEPLKAPEIEEITLDLLYKLIYQANLKMDRILKILEDTDTSPYASVGTEYVNISGSGMKFTADQMYGTGDIIALRIFLPLVSSTWITVLGKVVSSTELPTEGGYSTAVHFVGLPESDREMIIRYVFKRQRELLRVTSDMKDQE